MTLDQMANMQEDSRTQVKYATVGDQFEAPKSKRHNNSRFAQHKVVYTILVLFLIAGGIIAVVSVYKSSKPTEVPELRSGSVNKKYRSMERLGHMNVYMRKPSRDGSRRRPDLLRFPVARYNQKRFPLRGPFLSFMPSVPIFVDRLTKQTIIFAPTGGVYIMPPLINFYGKMYSVAELIASGYASLVSSGVPPVPPMNVLPFFQPTPLYGPGIPIINPLTGIFNGGIQTNYDSFRTRKYENNKYSRYEESEEEQYGHNYNDDDDDDNDDDDDYDRRPSYRERNYGKPRHRIPYKQERDQNKVCNVKFSSPTSYARENDAESLYVLDVNNDKIEDIVTLYLYGDALSILLGKGNGKFKDPIWIHTGSNSGPVELAAGDIDHDNKLDLVVTYYLSGAIAIFIGDGEGSFTLFKTYSTGAKSLPQGVVLSDLNGDDNLDMLVTCEDANNIRVYFGEGNGEFSHHRTYDTGVNTGPSMFALSDFNKDKKIDFVCTNFYSNEIVIYFGEGNGDFVKKYSYPTGAAPYNPVIGDFNNDGIIDIATANYQDNTTSIFHGLGNGKFQLKYTLSTGRDSMPYSIAAADINQDKILDLVVANSNKNEVGILFGIGNGNFKTVQQFSTGSGTLPYTAVAGDFNRDGFPDIATANNGTGDVSILLNKCP